MPVEALGTDYVDLGLGLTDMAVQSASAATGNGFDVNEVFNDANNPLTQARQHLQNGDTGRQGRRRTSCGLALHC